VPKSSAIPLQNGAEFDTIVIGGGIGGIAAAVELGKAGQNVAIFEANGYIGGRLKTIPVPLTAGGVVQFD
jgi:phytoene dehydrogenase-like protein